MERVKERIVGCKGVWEGVQESVDVFGEMRGREQITDGE